ncbi:MAG TPA: hypothetical protein GX396_01645 [Tissierellia bacterium]|nr:hypothetical protein [Tissierellia bacterium]
MKKRIIALTLTAALALSSTSAFAATTNCTRVNNKYYNSFFGNSINKNAKTDQYKIVINGKETNLKDIDWKSILKKAAPAYKAEKPVEVAEEPTTPIEVKEPAAPVEKPTTPVEESTPVEKPVAPAEKVEVPVENNTTVSSSDLTYEQKVVELVNIERQKAGLPTLTMDDAISNVARAKSKDMAVNNYFAHQSPTYGSAGDMLRQFGIRWSAWGENIAYGQRTPEIVVNAWMNSPGHRANILSPNFSKIGVGYVTNSNGTPYWTQIFTN